MTTVPTTTAAATGTRPSTDSNGTLVDNGDGTYKYTFYRDITQVKAQVAAMTFTGANRAADLGDLTYDPNAVHRVAMVISGNVPGTGTNTANEVQVVPGVPLAKPNNTIFDFIPATGQARPRYGSGTAPDRRQGELQRMPRQTRRHPRHRGKRIFPWRRPL